MMLKLSSYFSNPRFCFLVDVSIDTGSCIFFSNVAL